jgi:non-specific serine/threonine protein kinase
MCRQLDGIPLAIELAAARLCVLSPEQLSARMHEQLDLLINGNRTAQPRHQTTHDTLEWSYALLSRGERLLLRRLSVFSGDWGRRGGSVFGKRFGNPRKCSMC